MLSELGLRELGVMVAGVGCRQLWGVLGLVAAGAVADVLVGLLGEFLVVVRGVLERWVAGSFSL